MYQKFKTHLDKYQFYGFTILAALLTLALIVWILELFTVGTGAEFLKANGIDVNNLKEEGNKTTKIMTSFVLSYIGNSLIIIFFVIYVWLAARKIKVGYCFFIIWTVLFIALASMPFIHGSAGQHPIQLAIGIIIAILSSLISVGLIASTVKYYRDKQLHKYEWIKIHKGK
ncbi:hypothetical protein [Mycoplasma hafezii]|uniref:hypothetical protein n=1 Tax=Mycoplasma hafezii TaxID=525886 RepID=UPI003CF9A29D